MNLKIMKIIFLCTGNSCRSQMAEGWARALKSDSFEAFSAGTVAHGLNPHAVRIMADVGVDISGQRSKTVEDVQNESFDYIITVCGAAHESCPLFLGDGQIVHHGFDDPPALARNAQSDEEALSHYVRVRDEIKSFVETLPGSLPS